MSEKREYIPDIELADVQVKWNWSYFHGRNPFDPDAGPSFVIILPKDTAEELSRQGWNVKENEPYEEGDDFEYTLQAKISYKYEAPRVFLIKRGRKFRVEDQRDLADITRNTCEKLDVILTPSRWVQGSRYGITAYVKEMYATVRESRFAEEYADLEEI